MKYKTLFLIISAFCSLSTSFAQSGLWTKEKANKWYTTQPWLTGADYIPNNAINQLEMWQANTFSPQQIDKEFALAEDIGFNTMRVFLHSLAWKQDPAGFKQRIDKFLSIAQQHHIRPLFVFFDDCWRKVPQAGRQPDPQPGVHNSGWVQDPGDPASMNEANFPELEKYVKDILSSFAHDKRILAWDLYNEPGNEGKGIKTLPLLKAVFSWARVVNPDQPITAGLWNWSSGFKELNEFQIDHSDIITYHCYSPADEHLKMILFLQALGRPLICTEYMARTRDSRFATTMPILKKEKVGAINWGFVEGKTNTIYQWGKPIPDGSQPDEWFHDIFRKDFTPYRKDETDLIRKLNKTNP
ncbi:glycoside hydrolase 5 family protein [Chitinophaga vietnamensis]|uniref:cellulase family glycosylhydrolase n=1 Tax=Chitinophaga vietnamensis TaxID=2593957 RepID=UPI001177C649|nr:cellulase family glycosylhydrolase [Chitinophaga vietnamensis]